MPFRRRSLFSRIYRWKNGITATDIVLAITEFLRNEKVVSAYLEFFGEGAADLTIGDRATISNMTPEFGASAGMFYIDEQTIDYLKLTGRDAAQVELVENYAKTTGLWADDLAEAQGCAPHSYRRECSGSLGPPRRSGCR